ncbi:hypothetical protein DFH11DRAFT_1705942 [Phellopilus nigrolimitatus]|nr:hypothetical protein DFH11DRAFT_1705942 [Phellopilus nigrolimitatus]
MLSLLSAPADVQTSIFNLLSLQNIARLRQVCRKMNADISADKQLWVRLLCSVMESLGRTLVPYSRYLENADTRHIEAWIRSSLELERSYATSSTLRSWTIQETFSITWVKLLRGRWCLIAMSNSTESRLRLFELSIANGFSLRAETFLPGPVINGLVEDGCKHIHMAISIRTRNSFIRVLSVGACSDGFLFRSLAEIRGASHVQLLHGPLVGFSVYEGDDSYPRVANWYTGKIMTLFPKRYEPLPSVLAQVPSPLTARYNADGTFDPTHEICRAMTVWNRYFVVVFDAAVHIYLKPDLGDSYLQTSPALLLSILPLGSQSFNPVKSAYFTQRDIGETCKKLSDRSSPFPPLHIIIHTFKGTLSAATISFDSDAPNMCSAFSLVYHPHLTQEEIGGNSIRAACVSLSSSSVYAASLMVNCESSFLSSQIVLTALHLPSDQHDIKVSAQMHKFLGSCSAVSAQELPVLHLVQCIDFDDARGVLLLGSSIGEVSCTLFSGYESIYPESLLDDLPPLAESDIPYLDNYPEPIPVDMISYLSHEVLLEEGEEAPQEVVDEALLLWSGPDVNIAGWSNDWSRFKYLANWMMPPPVWGLAQPKLQEGATGSHYVRTCLRNLGDIVPVLYKESCHDILIFRAGQRLFILYGSYEEETVYINALRLPVDQIFNAHRVQEALESTFQRSNLHGRLSDEVLDLYERLAEIAFRIGRFMERTGRGKLVGAVSNAWSDSEWTNLWLEIQWYEIREGIKY